MTLRHRVGSKLIEWGSALLDLAEIEREMAVGVSPPPPVFDPDVAPAVAVRVTEKARALVFVPEPEKVTEPEPLLVGGVAERVARERAKMEMGR